jgi:hypothetical protein
MTQSNILLAPNTLPPAGRCYWPTPCGESILPVLTATEKSHHQPRRSPQAQGMPTQRLDTVCESAHRQLIPSTETCILPKAAF